MQVCFCNHSCDHSLAKVTAQVVLTAEEKRKADEAKAKKSKKPAQAPKAKGVSKRASFGKPKRGKIALEAPLVEMPESSDDVMHGAYNLTQLGLPKQAYPDPKKPNKGLHSYTLVGQGGSRIEILLRSRAFYVKAVAAKRDEDLEDEKPSTGQIAWVGGVADAWDYAVRRARYVPC